MFSLNAPVPSVVGALAGDLAAELSMARARRRGTRTLVVKRFEGGTAHARLDARAREVLRGAPACEARVAGIGAFEEPIAGPAPVVYLRVESPGLRRLHERLVEAFDPVPEFEGASYTPHVTVARGGDPGAARALTEREIEPVEWVVDELVFWDPRRELPVSRISLPA